MGYEDEGGEDGGFLWGYDEGLIDSRESEVDRHTLYIPLWVQTGIDQRHDEEVSNPSSSSSALLVHYILDLQFCIAVRGDGQGALGLGRALE